MPIPALLVTMLAVLQAAQPAIDAQATVAGSVAVVRTTKGAGNADVAIWLTPVSEAARYVLKPPTLSGLKILQRNKRFEPHVLVVPVGSSVDFPNEDPFFHNVFSMFDGRRFDLGLYEAGTSRAVPFTRTGVSYIFCNIHPEMSAVVVVVDTPYYATTNAAGEFAITNVPPGRYTLSVWHERYKPERPSDFPRPLIVAAPQTGVAIHLVETDDVIVPHKNKYGRDYTEPSPQTPIYKDR